MVSANKAFSAESDNTSLALSLSQQRTYLLNVDYTESRSIRRAAVASISPMCEHVQIESKKKKKKKENKRRKRKENYREPIKASTKTRALTTRKYIFAGFYGVVKAECFDRRIRRAIF